VCKYTHTHTHTYTRSYSHQTDANSMRILVVDDIAVNAVVLKKALMRSGFECDIVNDGIHVLPKLKVCFTSLSGQQRFVMPRLPCT
jgi:hypothetical protein